MTGFSPSTVITLTTDLGHKGPFVATMKGAILTRFAGAKIVDITHEIVPHWPTEVAFWLGHAYRFFPPGTIHAAVVDPGGGTSRDIIAGYFDGHAFIGPDNGQLTTILEQEGASVHRLEPDRLRTWGIHTHDSTFAGRDVIAPVAAEIAAGRVAVGQLGPLVKELVPSWVDAPVVTDQRVTGVVITVDAFGNLYTNIDGTMLRGFEDAQVVIAGRSIPIRRSYSEVEPGQYLALINSFGVLEIACAQSRAEDGLGAERGAQVVVRHGT